MPDKTTLSHPDRIQAVVGNPRTGQPHQPELAIANSWGRCLTDYSLDPASHHKPVVLAGEQLRERQQRLGHLLEIARAECQILYEQIARSGYAVLLTDAAGVIVNYVCDPTLNKEFQQAGLRAGADWSEESEGTNGIGTCLKEDRAVTVHRDDHFRNYNIGLSCSGTPIHDPDGKRVAVLDVSSVNCIDSRSSQYHTAALINMSARLIENSNFLHYHSRVSVLRFHSRPEFVGLLGEGLLAVDEDGFILGGNADALDQLGYEHRRQIVGWSINAIMEGITADIIAERVTHQPYAAWPIRDISNGHRFYCMVQGGVKSGSTPAPVNNNDPAPATTLTIEPNAPAEGFCLQLDELMGCDARMAYNVRCAKRVVNKNVAILLHGETGTGKEAFAQAIHRASARAGQPFVAVNCAAIPESLIESELFGYKHGAFTGARREGMPGSVVQSSGGTLFLDEIGDMPPPLQTRLLRVLEEKEVRPLGSQTSIPVDLHVLSASNCDIKELIGRNEFREDLYYRLNGMTLALPPLRERSDLEKLLKYALATENDTGQPIEIDRAAFQCLLDYSWPGNIRELRNVLRTALALCDENIVRLADLPQELAHNRESRETAPRPIASDSDQQVEESASADSPPLQRAERETILEELERNHWSITATAKRLKMSRSTLYRKAKKYRILITQVQ